MGAAIAISSFGIVRAERETPDNGQIFRCMTGQACVQGLSTGRAGGVYGRSLVREGVVGVSRSSTGVHGFSETGDGVTGESRGKGAVALRSIANGSDTAIFFGHNVVTRGHCVIDPKADLDCTGGIKGGGTIESTHRNSRGEQVLAYAPESATATIEDVGTARMVDGIANVRIDRAFAAMTDGRWYYVFLTPLGETRGLFVSRKAALGFVVREIERERSNLDFDYRIVAHPIDATNDRLPVSP